MANEKPKDVSAQTGASHVSYIVGVLGDEVNSLVTGLIRKGEEVAAGPLTVLQAIRARFHAKFGGEEKGDAQMSVEFPRLDTTFESGDTNAFTEIYEGEKPNETGELKTRKLNFFTEAWEQFDEGKAQVFVLRQIKLAKSKDSSKAEEKFRAMTPDALDNLQKRTTNAKTKGRAYLRKSIGVWFVMIDLADVIVKHNGNDICPVTLEFADDWQTNTMPLNLIDNTRLRKYRPMAIGDVLKLDVAAAKAEPGNLYDNLEKQMSRDTGAGKSKIPQLSSVDLWTDAALKMATAANQQEQAGVDLVTAIKKRMSQKKGGELAIRAVGELRLALNDLWSPAMQIRFDKQIEAETEQGGEDETAEQAAA